MVVDTTRINIGSNKETLGIQIFSLAFEVSRADCAIFEQYSLGEGAVDTLGRFQGF